MDLYTLKELSLLEINDEVYFTYKSEDDKTKGMAKVFQKTEEYIYFKEDDGTVWDFPLSDNGTVNSDKAYQDTGDYTFAIFKK